MKLGEILVRKQLITQPSFDHLLACQLSPDQPLGERLLIEELISEQHLHEALQEPFWRRNGFWLLESAVGSSPWRPSAPG